MVLEDVLARRGAAQQVHALLEHREDSVNDGGDRVGEVRLVQRTGNDGTRAAGQCGEPSHSGPRRPSRGRTLDFSTLVLPR